MGDQPAPANRDPQPSPSPSPDWESWDPLSRQDRQGTIVRQAVIVVILLVSSLFQTLVAFGGLDTLESGFRKYRELNDGLSQPALELQIRMREAHYQLYKASRQLADGLALADVSALLDQSQDAATESRSIFAQIAASRSLLPEGQNLLDYLAPRIPAFESRIQEAIRQLQTTPALALLTLQAADTEFGALSNALETLNQRCGDQGARLLVESLDSRAIIARQMVLASSITVLLVTILVLLSVRFLYRPLKDLVRRNARHMEGLIHDVDRLERLSSLSMLVTGLSHEMNTPLGNCITLSTHLKNNISQFQDESRQTELATSLEVMHRSLKKASDLVQTFKLIGAAQNCGERRAFTLDHLLAELHQDFKPKYASAGIDLRLPPTGPSPRLETYFDSLKLCLSVMLQNCLDHAFVDRGQRLRPDRPVVSLTIREIGPETLELQVDDNGSGMDDARRLEVFKPFHSLRHYQGNLGLGLYIAQTHATGVLGGSIRLEALSPGTRAVLLIRRLAP